MHYCENCKIVFENDRCPACLSANVRDVVAEDLVFLIEQDVIWSGMVEDLLKQNDIAFLSASNVGAGLAMRTGHFNECFRFFVPYEKFAQAKELMDAVFTAVEEDPS